MVFSSFQAGLPLILGKFGPPPQSDQPLVFIGWSKVTVSVLVVAASTSQARRPGEIATTFGGSWARTGTSRTRNDTAARMRMRGLRGRMIANAGSAGAFSGLRSPEPVAPPLS